MKEVTPYPPIRTEAIELIDGHGDVCMTIQVGRDGPEVTVMADPTVCRGPMTASLRVLTGGAYDAIQPLGERVSNLEDVLAIFGRTVQESHGGTIIADSIPGWERRELLLEAEIATRGDDAP